MTGQEDLQRIYSQRHPNLPQGLQLVENTSELGGMPGVVFTLNESGFDWAFPAIDISLGMFLSGEGMKTILRLQKEAGFPIVGFRYGDRGVADFQINQDVIKVDEAYRYTREFLFYPWGEPHVIDLSGTVQLHSPHTKVMVRGAFAQTREPFIAEVKYFPVPQEEEPEVAPVG